MLRVYRAFLRREVRLVLAYRAQIMIWILTGVMPLVMLAAWLSLGQGGPVGSFEPRDFIAYYLAAIFVRQMTGVWILWDMDYQIRQGEFSTLLLRPIDPMHHWAVAALGSKWLRFVLLAPTLGLAAYFTGAQYDTHPFTILVFVTAIINAWLLSFLIQYLNGLLAFWITQAVAVFDLWFGLWSIFSGYLIPLELLPNVVQRLAFWLPFRYQLAVPLEIILGRLHGSDLWIGLAMQWVWIAIGFLLCRLLWQRGLKKYSAVGA
jgi:ABC-2 type transport system permease protein